MYTLTKLEQSHLKALTTAAKGVTVSSATIRTDADSHKTEAALDAYATAARSYYRDTIKDEEQRKRTVGLFGVVIHSIRKARGYAAKRAKGAGRKVKEPRADKIATKLSPLDQCEVSAAHIIKMLPQVGATERLAFIGRFTAQLTKMQAAK